MSPTQNIEEIGDSAEQDEIERWWTPDESPPGLSERPSENIFQFYKEHELTKEITRFRRQGSDFYLGGKTDPALVRREKTKRISEAIFSANWPYHVGRAIRKRRYLWPGADGLTYEIDVFEAELKGRIKIEVEFTSVEQAEAFQPPAWFGREVTGDARYGNYSLAINGWPDSPE